MSWAQQGRAPALAKGSLKKQVLFNINEELGSEPTLSTGMTLPVWGRDHQVMCCSYPYYNGNYQFTTA